MWCIAYSNGSRYFDILGVHIWLGPVYHGKLPEYPDGMAGPWPEHPHGLSFGLKNVFSFIFSPSGITIGLGNKIVLNRFWGKLRWSNGEIA